MAVESLQRSGQQVDEDGKPARTGNVWTAASHVITAVIGSGVLSLAWGMAQLGWVVGPIVMVCFAYVTYYCAILLADCYRKPDGTRNYTYKEAVMTFLGGRKYVMCAWVQYLNLLGVTIGYTITASISMVAMARSDCFHEHGRNWHHHCYVSNNPYMIIFGVTQIFFSQIPNLHQMWWLSIVAAVMSFSYSTIGLGLAFAKTIGRTTDGKYHSYGTWDGASIAGIFRDANQTWATFQALGNVAFAYAFSMILVEIEDTLKLKSPPTENKEMKKASTMGVAVTSLFYMSVGFVGYAAFGNDAPGNLLTGFGFYNPFWLVDIANLFIVIHLVGAYQVFAQPIFAFVEEYCSNKWRKNAFINKKYTLKFPSMGSVDVTRFCLVWRTSFVIFTTLMAMLLPFFNDIVGILGAMSFYPLTVYFPVEMYIARAKIPTWSRKWVFLKIMSSICFLVSFVALVGSFASVITDVKHYTPFKTHY